jgi:hypothetical protein
MEVLYAVASGIKLGRCWLLMEVRYAVASGIKLGRCWLLMEVLSLLSLLSSGGSRENAAISSLGASLVVVVVFWDIGL